MGKDLVFVRASTLTFDGSEEACGDIPYGLAKNPAGSFSVDSWAEVAPGGSGLRSPLCSRDMPPPRGYCFCIAPNGRWVFWVGVPESQSWLKVEGSAALEGVWQRITGSYDDK